MNSIFESAFHCLMLSDPDKKCNSVFEFKSLFDENNLNFNKTKSIEVIRSPGHPIKPNLVSPRNVPRRSLATKQGCIALIHAIAHIEFNAINLALDAIYRFQELPSEYYSDWLQVAVEESQHFLMLRDRMNQLNYDYGDFDAHNGLWEMALNTSDSALIRMALVPRVLEARGLDVTPGMIKKLYANGEDATAKILEIIFEQEIGHVAIGSRWFKYLCEQDNLQPDETFKILLSSRFTGKLHGPFELDARRSAGFSKVELEMIQKY